MHSHCKRRKDGLTSQWVGPDQEHGGRRERKPEEERLSIRRGENSIRKNQCDSMTPLGVFAVSLHADGWMPKTPLGQKDPCNAAWIKDEGAGPTMIFYPLIHFMSSGHGLCLTGQTEPNIRTSTTQTSHQSQSVCWEWRNFHFSYFVMSHCNDLNYDWVCKSFMTFSITIFFFLKVWFNFP